MRVLFTVGSTRFDALVDAAFSQPVLDALTQKGYSDVVVQCGNSQVGEFSPTDREGNVRRHGVDIDVWRFKPSLDEEYDAADLVIGHAGSGTILDVLRRGKPLIIVPNPTLLDNHQEDMAHSMGKLGHARVSTVNELAQSVMDLDTSTLVPFPPFDGGNFRRLVDREMGFEL
ncbi:glycosyltransferase family 1 protein [Russula ochroleuca]|jgi:beta-1,4-N-acetylglucosaminyltransferase|uniref:UDP-N-acetylglucosamine transferase subunit ALG13 n=1 Tax=Russula ochroleuca TaxID=152965 RepID=A0A9P5T8K0_9AGAM|nr:glycosyltransferase family 1 protein [Russula ochroleuca]